MEKIGPLINTSVDYLFMAIAFGTIIFVLLKTFQFLTAPEDEKSSRKKALFSTLVWGITALLAGRILISFIFSTAQKNMGDSTTTNEINQLINTVQTKTK